MAHFQSHGLTLMVQGTSSDAGKSTLVAGLCRALMRRGWGVAPFKPQNMALNSFVTAEGGEIGRAQAVQAAAAGVIPHTDMNPVLLKPVSDVGCQVIIDGHAIGTMDALDYHQYKRQARNAVFAAYQRLAAHYDTVLVEGAGSPAEINLRDNDIANMGFAEVADCPVILVADIDRGGVFAQLVGTLALLGPSEQARIKGFVINKFRGDRKLLDPGLRWLEQHTGKPVLGVLPYLHGLHLEAEDALPRGASGPADAALRIVVPALPHISNHTDFDPLRLHPEINLRFVGPGEPVPSADLIILPGSKAVRSDLNWLRRHGWDNIITRHLRYGGKVLGICGGYQMLGKMVRDPLGLEGEPGVSSGLGWLDTVTVLEANKQLRNVEGRLAWSNAPVKGYEIHMGVTTGLACCRPFAHLEQGGDGAISADGQVAGTYLHGLFENSDACNVILGWAGLARPDVRDYEKLREQGLNQLADACARHLDLERIIAILRGETPGCELAAANS